jgi:MFS family permease
MALSNLLTKKGRVFYGWFTLVGAILVTVIAGGAFVGSFGVFLPVISNEFSWSRGAVSLTLSLGVIAFGLPGPLFGYFINRFGPRASIITGNLLAAGATAAVFLANQTWHYYLLYIIIGLGNGVGGYIAGTTLVNNWFVKKRALVMGIFTSSAGLSGFIFPPIVTALIAGVGFLKSWLVLALLVLFGASILGGFVFIRNRPEDIGQLPDGDFTTANLTAQKAAPVHGGAPPARRMAQVFKTKATWLIAAFVFADALAMGAVIGHQIAYFQDIGFSPMTAASTASFQSIFNILGSLTFGALSLRFNMRHLVGMAFFLQVGSLIILLTTKNLAMIYVYAALMGLSLGAILTAMASFTGAYYPREQYAQVIGLFLPFYVIGQSIAALGTGAIYDATQQYTLAFSILVVTSLAGLVCALLAGPPEYSLYKDQTAIKY